MTELGESCPLRPGLGELSRSPRAAVIENNAVTREQRVGRLLLETVEPGNLPSGRKDFMLSLRVAQDDANQENPA